MHVKTLEKCLVNACTEQVLTIIITATNNADNYLKLFIHLLLY